MRKGGGFGRGRGGMAGVGEDEGFLPEFGKKMNADASWSNRGVEGGDLSHLPRPSIVRTRGLCPAPCTSRAVRPAPPFKLLTRGHQQWLHMIGMVNEFLKYEGT